MHAFNPNILDLVYVEFPESKSYIERPGPKRSSLTSLNLHPAILKSLKQQLVGKRSSQKI